MAQKPKRPGRDRPATPEKAPPHTDLQPVWLLEWIMAGLATVTAIGLVASALPHGHGLWRDEVNSLVTASASSPAEFWRLLEFESFPALWLIALRGWMTVAGDSDAVLRLFGACGAVALIGAMWLAARRTSSGVPVLGLALVAVNADFLRWGSTVRAWSVGAALVIVAWIAMRELVTSSSRRSILLATIVSIAAVQTTYQNAVFIAAFAAAAAVELARSGRWRAALVPIGVAAVSGASLLPYGATLARRAAWIDVGQQPVDLASLLAKFSDGLLASGPMASIAWSVAALAALGLAFTRRGAPTYAGLTMVFSTLGLLAFYLAFGYPTQAWYYLALTAVIAVSIDAAVADARTTIWRVGRLSLAAVVLVTGFPQARSRVGDPFTNVDAVGRHLLTQAERGDLIVANPWYVGVSLHRYYTGEARIIAIPPGVDARLHRFDQVKAAMQDADPLRSAYESIESTLRAGRRVWVVGGITDAPPQIRTVLPAPPLPGTGWNSGPYEMAWTFAIGNLLRDHAIDRKNSPPFGAGGALESVELVAFRGWR